VLTELVLVRHGVTAWNRQKRFQGHIDIPLDDEGRAQARRAAARLLAERTAGAPADDAEGAEVGEVHEPTPPVTAIYASDLARARETAEPIAQALGLPLVVERGLRERYYGAFEGCNHDELVRDHAQAFERWRAREPDFELPGGGETLRAFSARVHDALLRLAQRHRGERIVAVTHGGFLDCAYRIASGLDLAAPRHHELLNASLNRIDWDGRRFSLVSWADVAHLHDSLDDVEARG
jgi:probable phosphoglycerate mutase